LAERPRGIGKRSCNRAALNKEEARNTVARAVFFHRRGAVRDRLPEDLQNKASGLNFAVAAIILWNTVYLQKASRCLLT
jgi:TnpA family transposase